MSVLDVIFVGIILFIFSISTLFAVFLMDEFGNNAAIKGSVAEPVVNKTKAVLFAFNDWLPFIFAGLMIYVFTSAYFVRTHPVMFVFSLVIMGFFILMSGILSNMFTAFAAREEFSGIINNYGTMVGFWNNFPFILLITGAIVIVALYAKGSRGGPIQ